MSAPQIPFGTPHHVLPLPNVVQSPKSKSDSKENQSSLASRDDERSPRRTDNRPYASVSEKRNEDSFLENGQVFLQINQANTSTQAPALSGQTTIPKLPTPLVGRCVSLKTCIAWLKSDESEKCKDITCISVLSVIIVTTISATILALLGAIDLHK